MLIRGRRWMRLEELETRWVPAPVWWGRAEEFFETLAQKAHVFLAHVNNWKAEAWATTHNDSSGRHRDTEKGAGKDRSGDTNSPSKLDQPAAIEPKNESVVTEVTDKIPVMPPVVVTNNGGTNVEPVSNDSTKEQVIDNGRPPEAVDDSVVPQKPVLAPVSRVRPLIPERSAGSEAAREVAGTVVASAPPQTPATPATPTAAAPAAQATESVAPLIFDLRGLTAPSVSPRGVESAPATFASASQQAAQVAGRERSESSTLAGGSEPADEVFAEPVLVLPRSEAPAQEELLTPNEIAAGLVVGAGASARVLSQLGSDLSGVVTVLGEGRQSEGELSPLAELMISPLDLMLGWESNADETSQEEEGEGQSGRLWRSVLLGAGLVIGSASAAGVGRRAGSRRKPGLGTT